MRTILILASVLLSCNPNPSSTELYFANSYRFVNTCELNSGKIKLPNSFTITDSDYKSLVSNICLQNDVTELNLTYDCNTSELDLEKVHLLFPLISSIIENFQTDKEEIIAGKITSHNYIYVFPIASGFCCMNFNFKNHISESDCQNLFNEYVQNIIVKTCNNESIPFNETARTHETIAIENKYLSITEKSVFGDFYLFKKSKDVVFKSKQDFSFKNCDQTLAYFNEMIIPYYYEFENGSLFTVINDNSLIKKKEDRDVLMQFIVRKNSNPNNPIGFTEKLSPVYLNKEISIKSKYAVEH